MTSVLLPSKSFQHNSVQCLSSKVRKQCANLHRRSPFRVIVRSSLEGSSSSTGESNGDFVEPLDPSTQKKQASDLKSKVAKLGLAAVLAYGLFDGVTYTTFFVLAFLGYEKSTGLNPATNLKSLLGIVVLMWTGNNVTRPFRVAGAAALAPLIDEGLKKLRKVLNLPSVLATFLLVVGTFASLCFSVVGVLILSRLGKP